MRKVTLTIGLASLVAMSAIGCGAATSSQEESSVTTKKAAPALRDNAITVEEVASWSLKFGEHPAVKTLNEDTRGLDPREYELSSEQCRVILAHYDAVLKLPMPPFKPEDFQRYLEGSREAYDLACKGKSGSVLDSQIKDALKAQNEWAGAIRDEFPEAKNNFVYLTDFPF